MKLLLFSDLHRDTNAAGQLLELAADADVAIGAGDFATMHQGLDDIIHVLSQMACPAILVPGNSETYEELSTACRDWQPEAKEKEGGQDV